MLALASLPALAPGAFAQDDAWGGVNITSGANEAGIPVAAFQLFLGVVLAVVLTVGFFRETRGGTIAFAMAASVAVGVALFIGLLDLWFAVLVWLVSGWVVLKATGGRDR